MSKPPATHFEPRKTPTQQRSTASVDAILQATIQVLLKDGRAKLTTTRVAQRAGVSVGTLYQYFPNKDSLLQTLLSQHLDAVASAMETACLSAHNTTLANMADTLTTAFLQAKFRDVHASAALYAISDSLEGKRIARAMHTRSTKAMTAMLETAKGKPLTQPAVVAATLLSAMAGVSRAMLESPTTPNTLPTMQQELKTLIRAYLQASSHKLQR